jgi:hypothetical protein
LYLLTLELWLLGSWLIQDGLPLGTHFPLFLAMAVMKQDIDDMS